MINKYSMKQENKNKKQTNRVSEEDELTLGHINSKEDGHLSDNLSEQEELLSEQVIDEVETLEQKYEELNNNHLRLHAEFDNYRKRTLKEKMEIIKAGGERVLSDMIPLIDDFERALETVQEADDKEAIIRGLELIYNKFINFLNQNGVKEIQALGEKFDADKFEAVTTVPAQDDSQKDVVIDCIQKGYILNDKVLRFPKVIVGK